MDRQPDNAASPLQLDASRLRGLAHPVRIQILGILGTDGAATSTTLADRLGLRTGTTSWHLLKLAEHGFIEEVPDRGTRRERWWRAAVGGWQIDSAAFLRDPELAEDTRVVLTAVIGQQMTRAIRFLHEDWSEPWRQAWMLGSTGALYLQPARLAALREELWQVVERYRETPAADDDDTDDLDDADDADDAGHVEDVEQVVVQLQAFPVRGGVW